ncbi:hypothetical protein [Clostridium sp. YIM B02551]|uniref:hypothetical protein n=1 Tax=Clostridium sp. YIM B02551 TaxID=2910679 RepID=UPI001EEAD47F|nr:hypothetical protein [Clostridium sp. YIM B02551]
MAIKDYLKFFSTETNLQLDYIITFKDMDRPNITDFPALQQLGNWDSYGEHGFRISCKLPKDKFEEIISEEMNISKDKFTIINSAEFAGARFF